ncbi:MAG: prepilin-type N-terminal cleavage/methylation domain-containing protein [Terriglobia bacterium]
MQSRQNGFSLVELLIVVTIILIIVAIAVPNFVKVRMVANEAAVVAALRTIINNAHAYHTFHSEVGFPSALADMGPPPDEGLIDEVLASGVKSGYRFDYQVTSTTPCPGCVGGQRNDDFRLCADPISGNRTGRRAFFTTADGVVHFLNPVPDGAVGPCAANATHPLLQ